MRSRPELAVFLSPREPCPGEVLEAAIRLSSDSRTPYDAVDVTLVGEESRYKRTVSTGDASSRQYHKRRILGLRSRFDAGTLEPGIWERRVRMELPSDVPPSYRSKLATIEYLLKVRVHIPWWPDREAEYEVRVRPCAEPLTRATPPLYTTQKGEHRGTDPVLELSLDHAQAAIGGTISGAVALTGLGERRIRRIEVACETIEAPLVKSAAGPTEVDRRVWSIHDGTPRDGEPVAFRLAVPEQLCAGFCSPFVRVSHVLEARAVVAFGTDLTLRVPFAIVRAASREPPLDSAPPLPLLGRGRHAAVWRAAAAKARAGGLLLVAIEPTEGTAQFDVGSIRVTVTEEHREGLGPCLTGNLQWPTIGLGLRLAERRWTDFGAKIDTIGARFQKRFTIEARESPQAAAVLDEAVQKAIAAFDEAGLDDEACSVLRKGGVYQTTGLERFLALVQALARALSHAFRQVPPPAAFAATARDWRRFAKEHGARLREGDMSLHDWVVGGVALGLSQSWERSQPMCSRLAAELPEGVDPAIAVQTLTVATGRPCSVEGSSVAIDLPTVRAPQALLPLAERFATALGKLRCAPDKGPYR